MRLREEGRGGEDEDEDEEDECGVHQKLEINVKVNLLNW
jgi:hypothetical protein